MAAGAINDDGGAAIVTYFGVASIPCPTSPDRAKTWALGLWGQNSNESRLASVQLGIGDVGEDFRL